MLLNIDLNFCAMSIFKFQLVTNFDSIAFEELVECMY